LYNEKYHVFDFSTLEGLYYFRYSRFGIILGLVHVVIRILESVSIEESLILSHLICVLVSQKLVLV